MVLYRSFTMAGTDPNDDEVHPDIIQVVLRIVSLRLIFFEHPSLGLLNCPSRS